MIAIDTTSILKALADDVRLGLVRKLAQRGCATNSCDLVQSCASFLKLSQPAISHHFGKLVDAGVITEEKSGTKKVYTLNTELLQSIGIDVHKL